MKDASIDDQQHDSTSPDDASIVSRRHRPKVYKVPRKFDLSTIFVVTFAYAGALSAMQAVHLHLTTQLGIMALLTIVGIAQMFGPERWVRTASVLSGILCMAILFVVLAANEKNPNTPILVFDGLCSVLGFGPLLGYGAGALVGGLFLLIDYVRRIFGTEGVDS